MCFINPNYSRKSNFSANMANCSIAPLLNFLKEVRKGFDIL